MRSLEKADYLGTAPSLTIELPQDVEPQLLKFLRDVKWPAPLSGKLTIRRRVQAHNTTPAESAAWTAESFYPRDPDTCHVLVLSPQAELAPSFYHYLKFAILKYKHEPSEAQSNLLGISLDLPTSKLAADDEAPFDAPAFPARRQSLGKEETEVLPHLLWQAPNSNAALYFGDKWAEFHLFLSRRLSAEEKEPERFPPDKKLVSKKYPAFMEFLLQLALSRGYYMLYPSFIAESILSLARTHEDLYQQPDEFRHDALVESTSEPTADGPVDNQGTDSSPSVSQQQPVNEKPISTDSTLATFLEGFSLSLPWLSSLDLLSFGGRILSKDAYQQDTENYAKIFSAS